MNKKIFFISSFILFFSCDNQNEDGPISNETVFNEVYLTSDEVACKGKLFYSPSFPSTYLSRTINAYTVACNYFGDVRPLELWLTANTEEEAKALRNRWCDYRQSQDITFNAEWCQRSQIGVNLANYVYWSNIYYKGMEKEHHQLNLCSFSFSNNDLSAEYVTIHEFFHAYQSSHLDNDIYNTPESRDENLGRNKNGNNPWHTEGSADFFGHYLTSISGHPKHFKEEFERRIDIVEKIIDTNFSLLDLTYEIEGAYYVGSWAIVYLISMHSIEDYLGFYDILNEDGFANGFLKSFSQSLEDFDKSFSNWFRSSSRVEKMQLLSNIQ